MLRTLSIHHFVTIDSLDIDFKPGFSVITGETGVGKSILFEALSLVLGRRLSSRFLKGNESPKVTAVFDRVASLAPFLEDHSLQDPWVIEREQRLTFNGCAVSHQWLKSFTDHFVVLHEQKWHFDLSKILDEDLDLTPMQNAYRHYIKEKQKWVEFQKQKEIIESQRLYFEMAKTILSDLNPQPTEEEDLLKERSLLIDMAKTIQNLHQIKTYFHTPYDLLSHVEKMLRLCPEFLRQDLKIGHSHLLDLYAKIEDHEHLHQESASRLQEIDERLSQLRVAAKQLKTTTDHLPFLLIPLDSLKAFDDQPMVNALNSYRSEAQNISKQRQNTAQKVLDSLRERLKSLSLEKMRLHITHSVSEEPHLCGVDTFKLLCATQEGAEFMPVEKIVSGGEMARLSLLLRSLEPKPIFLFDEIDTGVSGRIALSMGKTLKTLGPQVIAITHSPQVAACGDHFYVVEHGKVRCLESQEERIHHIAILLSGQDVTEAALRAAEELYESSR